MGKTGVEIAGSVVNWFFPVPYSSTLLMNLIVVQYSLIMSYGTVVYINTHIRVLKKALAAIITPSSDLPPHWFPLLRKFGSC